MQVLLFPVIAGLFAGGCEAYFDWTMFEAIVIYFLALSSMKEYLGD